jgi:hypothetical protein
MIIPRSLDVRETRDASLNAIQNLLRRGYADDRVELLFWTNRKPWKNGGAGRDPNWSEGVLEFGEYIERSL